MSCWRLRDLATIRAAGQVTNIRTDMAPSTGVNRMGHTLERPVDGLQSQGVSWMLRLLHSVT